MVALLAIALFSAPGAASAATPTSQPALTLVKNCSIYPPYHGVDVALTGLPANTRFTGMLAFPGTGFSGPVALTTDADGTFFLGPFGSEEPGVFQVSVTWSGGTLTASLNVNCGQPSSSDECKNGGWREFGSFKSQGRCIAFTERPA